jgi:outer membrane autotransporter protein
LPLALSAAIGVMVQDARATPLQQLTIDGTALTGPVSNASYTFDANTPPNLTITGNLSGSATAIENIGTSIGTLGNSVGVVGTGASGESCETSCTAGSGSEGVGIYNSGTISALTNSGTTTGNGGSGGAGLNDDPLAEGPANGGAGGNGYGIYNVRGTIGTVTNSGTISGNGGSGGASEEGVIIDGGSGGAGGIGEGVYNNGTIGTLNNASGASIVGNGGTGGATFATLETPGGVGGNGYGIYNADAITTLNNYGTISGNGGGGGLGEGVYINNPGVGYGIYNTGTVETINNFGTVTGNGAGGLLGGNGYGIDNDSAGTIGTLTNSGSISASSAGEFDGNAYGIYNAGTIGTLTNTSTGSIGDTAEGIDAGYGIYNSGAITALSNSGTITSSGYAIYNDTTGTLGPITNSGVIQGNIVNASAHDLTINGGTGTTFGTLTGYSGAVGTITNSNGDTLANVVFASGNLLLNDNIVLASNGTASGNVNNTGAVLQVNQPITITGNYNQTGGALQVGVVSATQSGELVVTGNTSMTAGAVNIVPATYALAAGQRYVVVDTAGTANYGAGLTYSAGAFVATGTTTNTSGHTDLVVTLSAAPTPTPSPSPSPTPSPSPSPSPTPTPTPTPTPSPTPTNHATAPNSIAALAGLANYSGINNAGLQNLRNASLAIDQQGSTAAANRAGAQLAPLTQSATSLAAMAPTLDVLNIVSVHADSLRLAQADGESGVSTGEAGPAFKVWGQAFGGHASQDERDDVDGYSANFGGLLFGVDHAIGDAWRAGGVFSYSNTAINNTGDTAGDTTRVNSYGLMAYANYTAQRWYANLAAGVVQQRYDTSRIVDLPGAMGYADGSFSGTQYVARAEAGYPLAVGPATVTPLASLTYGYLHQNGYTETGSDGPALAVGATHTTSVTSDIGAKVSRELSTSYGVLVPELQLTWRHEYESTRVSTVASYAAAPAGETSFSSLGASPVQDSVVMDLGVTLLRANNLSVSARYELQAGSGYVAQAGMLRLRQLF